MHLQLSLKTLYTVQMAESEFWHYLRNNIPGHLQRIEDSISCGIPDVNYCIEHVEGWIELKWVPAWPKRLNTCIKIQHFTSEQFTWLAARYSAGGRVFLFIQVESCYMLFSDITAIHCIYKGKLGRLAMQHAAQCVWHNRINFLELIHVLARD